MMGDANYDGPLYGFITYGKAPMMLSHARRHRRRLGGDAGDVELRDDLALPHPSPWDYMFAMNRELNRDLGWFWYYWLFTTESVDGSIDSVVTKSGKTHYRSRCGRSGEMPAPVMLKVEFAADGPALKPMKNAVIDGQQRHRDLAGGRLVRRAAGPSWRSSISAGGGSRGSPSIPRRGFRIGSRRITSGRARAGRREGGT